MADYNGIDIKEYAENGLNDVSGLINRREYDLGIIKARQIAERLVRSYASEKNIEYTTLADTIEKLYSAGFINMDTRDAFHTIRIYANKVVHETDESSNDAENALYLLKNEVQTFMSRKNVSVDRTPIRIERNQTASYLRRQEDERTQAKPQNPYEAERTKPRYDDTRDNDEFDIKASLRKDRAGYRREDDYGNNSRRTARNERRRGDIEERSQIGIYDILKVLIPAVVVILIIIIIKSLMPSKPAVTETSSTETTIESTTAETEATVEETTVEETTEPETEAPVSYKIKGDGVNVRYADNQNRIYAQLSNGTAIGEVTPIDGSDFVQFTLDGVSVVVRKDFIEPAG